MKNLIFIASLLPLFVWGQQQEPMFKTTFYFEDAVGNRDSITVGMDTSANWEYNPQLGEIDIQTPFDSVFEVRAAHTFDLAWGDTYTVLSKTIINVAEIPVLMPNCYKGGPFTFLIQAKYQPVTISWSQSVFNDECLDGSFMTPDKNYELLNPWDWWSNPEIRFSCQEVDGSYAINLGGEYLVNGEWPYIKLHDVQGSTATMDSIYGVTLWIDPFETWTPCYHVSVEGKKKSQVAGLKIFPNPTNNFFQILDKDENYLEAMKVIDINGNIVLSKNKLKTSEQIDVSNLSNGVFFIEVDSNFGQKHIGKLIKKN